MAKKQMAKDNVEPQIIREPREEYRIRFVYCSIGATMMCIGVITLISGAVVYILASTSPHNNHPQHLNNMFLHISDYNNSYWPIIVAIILSSTGIAFITIAIVFTLFACFSHGRIEDHFRNQSMQLQQAQLPQTQPVTSTMQMPTAVNHHDDNRPYSTVPATSLPSPIQPVHESTARVVKRDPNPLRQPMRALHDSYYEEADGDDGPDDSAAQEQTHLLASSATSKATAPTIVRSTNPMNKPKDSPTLRSMDDQQNVPQHRQQQINNQTNKLKGHNHGSNHHSKHNDHGHHTQYVPIHRSTYTTREMDTKQSAELTELNSSTTSSTASSASPGLPPLNHIKNGDINTVGLPPLTANNTISAHKKKVPTNGFTYLQHPEEIHIIHEYMHHHQHQRSFEDPNNNNHIYNQPQTAPSSLYQTPAKRSATLRNPSAAAAATHESVL